MTEPGPPTVLAACYARTEAGRAEIQRRSLPLSRPGRNLLLTIDASRTAAAWLGLVQGATAADLQTLLDAGLVAETPAPGGVPRMSLAQALATKGDATLRSRIAAEARPRLGMIKGYRLVAELERCSSPEAVRALAQRFVEQVRATDGDAAAVALAQVLLAPG